MRPRLLTVLLALGAARGQADVVSLMPQQPNQVGFVTSSGSMFADEIATGGIFFVLLEPEARGWSRFDLGPIPAGSTIDAVRLIAYLCNHDLNTGTACPKPAYLVNAGVDPLVTPGGTLFAAIGSGTVYQSTVIARSGPAFCLEYYVPLDLDLGPTAAADVEAALPAGWFTVGLRSDTPCVPDSDHLDWIGFSETINAPDPVCTLTSLPGSRIQLVVTYTPPVLPCNVAGIAPISRLLAVKSSDRLSVDLSWQGDPAADGYNLWHVDPKDLIPQARAGGAGTAVAGCQPTSATACRHAGAVAPAPAGPRLYYQARGECGGTEAAE